MTEFRRKYKVLLTLNNNRLSGIERFALLLADYIDKEKYEVRIGMPWEGSLSGVFMEHGVDYFTFSREGKKAYGLSAIVNLVKHFIRNRYDIVHAQAGIVPCILGKIFGARLVIEHKHGLDFTKEYIESMSRAQVLYEKLKKYFVDFAVTVCEADRQTLITRFGYDPDKVRTIYNGIEYTDSLLNPGREVKIIGTVGRLTYQKSQEYLIEAAVKLKEFFPGLEFHIYGSGENLKMYEDLIRDLNAGGYVFLKGYTSDVASVLRTFDLFVLPSRYEGIPYVILEAMEAGLPIVCTDVGGVTEIVRDGLNGIVVEKENTGALVSAVKNLVQDSELRKNISIQARNDLVSAYSVQNTVSKVTEIFKLAWNK